MAPMIPFITDNGRAVESPSIMRRAMEYATDLGLPIATHCETAALNRDGAMNEGRTSYSLGLPGMPSISEEICIERDLRLAAYTGAHLHVQQVSTSGGIHAIRRAKAEGVSVTCEVSPHHLIFTETDIGDFRTNFKTNPPLRTESDVAALLAGLLDGTVDAIASDHSPQSEFAKASDFGSAPFGVTGLDTALVALHDRLVGPGHVSWSQLIEFYCAAPRRIVGEPAIEIAEGQPAELVVFDPTAESQIDRAFFGGEAVSSPFSEETLTGSVRRVFCPGTAW
jgi:dihydroorotase